MKAFCARCGRDFSTMALKLTAPGQIARCYTHCPSKWGAAFQAPLVTVFPDAA